MFLKVFVDMYFVIPGDDGGCRWKVIPGMTVDCKGLRKKLNSFCQILLVILHYYA